MSEKKRSPNFTAKEKTMLLNIIFTFKEVIECKKTDAITWKQKDEAWKKVTNIFNSQTTETFARTKESLKKFYDNVKKNVRKEVAAEKYELNKTGGGIVLPVDKEPTTDLVLDIINEKTVFGFTNIYDSDYIAQDGTEKETCEEIPKSLEGEHFHDYCSVEPEINNKSKNIPEASRKPEKILGVENNLNNGQKYENVSTKIF